MSKQPDNRFQTADEVESVLTRYLAHLEQPRSQPKPRIRRTPSHPAYRIAATIAIPILLLAAILWGTGWFNNPIQQPTPPSTQTEDAGLLKGLLSPDSLAQEIEKLEQDILKLEHPSATRSGSAITDPIDPEARQLERSVQQLEQLFGK